MNRLRDELWWFVPRVLIGCIAGLVIAILIKEWMTIPEHVLVLQKQTQRSNEAIGRALTVLDQHQLLDNNIEWILHNEPATAPE